MKKLLYLFSLPALLVFASCGGNQQRESDENEETDSLEQYQEEPVRPESMNHMEVPVRENIDTENLPENISIKIEEDNILSSMELEDAVLVTEGDNEYYDLTFKDEDKQSVMVSFDSEGNLIEL